MGGGPRSPRPTEPTPPELRLLRYFIAVAEDSSFTRAAERLFIAQPSLSAAIRQLERQLGVVLLTRDSRHVALTPAGEALLPHASGAIASAERGVRAAQAAAESRLEVLRVLYTHRLEPVALDALDRLEASDPPVPVTAHGVWAGELVRALGQGSADVGVVRFPADNERLVTRQLRGDPVCALVAESDAPTDPSVPVALGDLIDRPLLTWATELGLPQYNTWVLDVCSATGTTPDTLTVTRLDDSGWLRVADGRAFALIGATERVPGGTARVTLRDAPRMPLYVVSSPSTDGRLTDAFADAVQAGTDALARRH